MPLQYCEIGDRDKYQKAEKARPKDPNFQGVSLILVAKAPAPMWQIKKSRRGKLLIRRPKNWPLVNHYHFHIMDKQRSEFRYSYSTYQLEYSRNLLFKSGRQLDAVYQGLIDRTRRVLDVPRLKTIFGRKQRPSKTQARDGRLEKIIERSVYDLTVFKVHFGKLTLKMYDKGDRVLRVEVIVNNIEELRCGKRLEKLPGMLERLQSMVVEFLGVVQAAHLSFIDGQQLDALAAPSVRGKQRTAGVDLQKPRMR